MFKKLKEFWDKHWPTILCVFIGILVVFALIIYVCYPVLCMEI